jgi:hydrogenase nickel incorporation protein HypB
MTCGCGNEAVNIDGQDADAEHQHVGADGMIYRHRHQHAHAHQHAAGHSHAPGVTPTRSLQIEHDILARNDGFAAANRRYFAEQGVLALNLVSSPGSGKTSLLVRTIAALQGKIPLAVIEGDQQTSLDAERIRAAGAAAVQINTGKGCHLDAQRVQQALATLALAPAALLFIENVGNLVCPAAFDLGEACKVLILSVTEGEDKPLKYPDMFAAARLMLINKCDLLPHLDYDLDRVIENARRVNPAIEVLQVSARSGAGMQPWLDWLASALAAARGRRAASDDASLRPAL